MHLALVQTLHRAKCSPKFPQISIDGTMTSSCRSFFAGPSMTVRFLPRPRFLHFQALFPLSFSFICTLQWCKYCSGVEVIPNFRKFPLTVLCGIEEPVISRPVFDGMPFLPTQILHFQTLLPLSFLLICTLQRCKH